MVRWIEAEAPDLTEFCGADAFGTRILAQLQAYAGQSFAGFWVQEQGGRLSAVCSRVDGALCLSMNEERVDIMELRAFLQQLGFSYALMELSCAENLGYVPERQGAIQRFQKAAVSPAVAQTMRSDELAQVWRLLTDSGFRHLGSYGDWLADIAAKYRCGAAQFFAVHHAAQLQACAGVLFRTRQAAFLGAIAAKPECRGKGIAGGLVTAIALAEQREGRRVELFCEENVSGFYQKIGFEKIGEWVEVAYI